MKVKVNDKDGNFYKLLEKQMGPVESTEVSRKKIDGIVSQIY